MAFSFGNEKKIDIIVRLIDETKASIQNIENNMAGLESTVENNGVGFLKLTTAIGVAQGAIHLISGAFQTLQNVAGRVFDTMLDAAVRGGQLDMMNITVETLAENLGVSSDRVNRWRKELEESNTWGVKNANTLKALLQTGLYDTVEALNFTIGKDGTTKTGVAGLIGMLKNLAAAAGIESEQAIMTFVDALMQQNPAMISNMVRLRDLSQVYNEYAGTLGKTSNELSTTERAQAFLNEFMKEGSKFAGVYTETYDTAGKSVLSLQSAIGSLAEEFGVTLQPVFGIFVNMARDFVKSIRDFVSEHQAEITGFVQRVADAVNLWKEAVTKWWQENQEVLQPKIDALVDSLKNLGENFINLITPTEQETEKIGELATELASGFLDNLTYFVDSVAKFFKDLKDNPEHLDNFVQSIKNLAGVFGAVNSAVSGFLAEYDRLKKFADQVQRIVNLLMTAGLSEIIPFVKDLSQTPLQTKDYRSEYAKSLERGFARGGIVGEDGGGLIRGASMIGDRQIVRANAREMILTLEQQKNLFSMIAAGGSGGTGTTVNINNPVVDSSRRLDEMINAVKLALARENKLSGFNTI